MGEEIISSAKAIVIKKSQAALKNGEESLETRYFKVHREDI